MPKSWLQFFRILFSAGFVGLEKNLNSLCIHISAAIGLDRNPSWLIFLPKCTCLFPECKNQLPRNGLSLILIVIQFFTLVCHDITHPPYDYRIFCLAHRLKKTNRNSLPNSHSFNTCHSQSTHHNDFSLPAPPSSFNPSNDVKIPPHIREN